MKSNWTRAGVRHKTPRWYWARWDADSEAFPIQMWLDEAGGAWFHNPYATLRSSAPWDRDGYERSRHPINEPSHD